MLGLSRHRAVSAAALAAFVCVPVASAQDDSFHVLDVVEGYWGWVLPEGEESDGTCDNDPLHIWLSEDRRRYFSTQESWPEPAEGPILTTDPGWLLIQYDDEERLTDEGEPVAWVLFMDSRDQFRWIRRDWIGTGRSTYPMVRCDDPQIG